MAGRVAAVEEQRRVRQMAERASNWTVALIVARET